MYRDEQITANRPFYNPDTTSIKAPDGEGCPRCGGKVFAAEQQLAKSAVSIYSRIIVKHKSYFFRYKFEIINYSISIKINTIYNSLIAYS